MAGDYEQLDPYDVQDPDLGGLQSAFEITRFSVDLIGFEIA